MSRSCTVWQDDVLRGLRREATLTGERTTHAACVSAWGLIGKQFGMFVERRQQLGGGRPAGQFPAFHRIYRVNTVSQAARRGGGRRCRPEVEDVSRSCSVCLHPRRDEAETPLQQGLSIRRSGNRDWGWGGGDASALETACGQSIQFGWRRVLSSCETRQARIQLHSR